MNIEVHKLEKRFGGVHAVDHVDVVFRGGEITGLVGPNGSGKTTLIHVLTGVLPADGGEIVVDGTPYRSLSAVQAARANMTRTFQNSRLVPQISVLDNVLLVLAERRPLRALFETRSSEAVDKAEAILRKVGLFEHREKNAEELSYGQRKLLEIARAVLSDARAFFFDEPFSGLFPEMVKIASGIIRELRESGATIVLVEHDMALIRSLADSCYVLDSGKVIASGSPESVLKDPVVVEAYLGK